MRIAQIYDNKAHWIFEADEIPNWPPDQDGNKIILIDITNNPEIMEGWDYNSKTNKFTKPSISEYDINNSIIDEINASTVTNKDLMEISLLNTMLTLENSHILRSTNLQEEVNCNNIKISHLIIKGFANLVFREKIKLEDLPKNYKNLVEEELNLIKETRNNF